MGPQAKARRQADRLLSTAALRAEYATASLRKMAARRGMTKQAMRCQLMVRGIARRPRGGDFRKWIVLAGLLLVSCQSPTAPPCAPPWERVTVQWDSLRLGGLSAERWHRHPTPTPRGMVWRPLAK